MSREPDEAATALQVHATLSHLEFSVSCALGHGDHVATAAVVTIMTSTRRVVIASVITYPVLVLVLVLRVRVLELVLVVAGEVSRPQSHVSSLLGVHLDSEAQSQLQSNKGLPCRSTSTTQPHLCICMFFLPSVCMMCLVLSPRHAPTHSPTDSLTHSLTYSLVHSHTHTLTVQLTHSHSLSHSLTSSRASMSTL